MSLFATFLAFCDFVSIIFCNFDAYFSKETTKTYLLKFSSRISTSPEKQKSKTYTLLEYAHKRRLHHKCIGVVLNLTGDMAVVCAISLPKGSCSASDKWSSEC